MKQNKKTVIAVDFDRTLSLGPFPDCGPANEPLIAILKWLIKKPLEERDKCLVLWTSRKDRPLTDALAWLAGLGLVFDGVNSVPPGIKEFPDDTRKIWADIYIDDKSMTPEQFIQLYEWAK